MVVLVTALNEESQIKTKGTRVLRTLTDNIQILNGR